MLYVVKATLSCPYFPADTKPSMHNDRSSASVEDHVEMEENLEKHVKPRYHSKPPLGLKCRPPATSTLRWRAKCSIVNISRHAVLLLAVIGWTFIKYKKERSPLNMPLCRASLRRTVAMSYSCSVSLGRAARLIRTVLGIHTRCRRCDTLNHHKLIDRTWSVTICDVGGDAGLEEQTDT